MKFIFLSGFSGSGKDTVADLIVHEFNYVKYTFAYPIKDSVSTALGIPTAWCSDQEKKSTYMTPKGLTLREHIIQVAERGNLNTKEFLDKAFCIAIYVH